MVVSNHPDEYSYPMVLPLPTVFHRFLYRFFPMVSLWPYGPMGPSSPWPWWPWWPCGPMGAEAQWGPPREYSSTRRPPGRGYATWNPHWMTGQSNHAHIEPLDITYFFRPINWGWHGSNWPILQNEWFIYTAPTSRDQPFDFPNQAAVRSVGRAIRCLGHGTACLATCSWKHWSHEISGCSAHVYQTKTWCV